MSHRHAGVRPIIWAALGNDRYSKRDWTTQTSEVCMYPGPKALSGPLMAPRMSGLVQNQGGVLFNNNFKSYFKTINSKRLCHEKSVGMCMYN